MGVNESMPVESKSTLGSAELDALAQMCKYADWAFSWYAGWLVRFMVGIEKPEREIDLALEDLRATIQAFKDERGKLFRLLTT